LADIPKWTDPATIIDGSHEVNHWGGSVDLVSAPAIMLGARHHPAVARREDLHHRHAHE